MEERLHQLAKILEDVGEPTIIGPGTFAPNGHDAAAEQLNLHRAAEMTAQAMKMAWIQAAIKTEECARTFQKVHADLLQKMAQRASYCREMGESMASEVNRAVHSARHIAESMSSVTTTVVPTEGYDA